MRYDPLSKNNYLCKLVFAVINPILLKGGAIIRHNDVLLLWPHKFRNLCQEK